MCVSACFGVMYYEHIDLYFLYQKIHIEDLFLFIKCVLSLQGNISLYAIYFVFNTDLTAMLHIHGKQDAQIFLLEILLETHATTETEDRKVPLT